MRNLVGIILLVFGALIVFFGNTANFSLSSFGQCLTFGLLFGGLGILATNRKM